MLLRIFLLFGISPAVIFAVRLNKFIKHYEVLTYDPTELHSKHERARRSIAEESEVKLDFNAHGRHFKLRLKRNAPNLSPNLIVESSLGTRHHKPDYLYTGKLEDEDKGSSHGAIINGVFRGTIYDKGEAYYVEPASYHFEQPKKFHSVIYKGSDVEDTHGSLKTGSCGAKNEIQKKMEAFAKTGGKPDTQTQHIDWSKKSHHASENKYTNPQHRGRRDLGQLCQDQKTSCNLYIQADHTFTRYFGGKADSDDIMIIENAVIAALNDHVSAVNAIYNPTKFGDCINIGFSVDRIRINGTKESNDRSNPFRSENIGVEKFLELNSLQRHDEYCLAYIFADRDFNDGVLGLAWVGSTGSTSGGICEKYKKFSGGISQSLNTGIVTIQNYGSHVPSKVSHITFAHELGHNFGSPHDYPLTCRPGDNPSQRSLGNYIMYASATSGDRANNNKFSGCSLNNMTQVIQTKGDCFVQTDRAVCGNRIVDPGEECDCGYTDQCDDTCCTPRKEGVAAAQDPEACKRAKKTDTQVPVDCSPSQGPCCDSARCEFILQSLTHECRAKSECSSSSYCNGTTAACPDSNPVDNMIECNSHKQTCIDGECSGSICVKFGFQECYCPPPGEKTDDHSCHLCCQKFGDPETCMSTLAIEEFDNHTRLYGEESPYLEDDPTLVLWQQPGAPCNEYKGYCDVFYKCRDVDSNGPLSRLTQAILNPELYKNIADWIKVYWWAALLIALGVVILMAIFIQICSVHTPSSNPNLPKHRQLTLPRSRTPRNRTNNLEMA